MIISPSQDSFYNSFADIYSSLPSSYDSPFSMHLATPPIITTTNQDPSSSYHGISSHISSSKLIVSPSEKSGDFETSVFELPTTGLLHSKLNTHCVKYVSFSDAKIETATEYAMELESPNDLHASSEELVPSKLGWSEDTKSAQRQKIHASISLGLPDIMAKVVLETDQNSPRRKMHLRRYSAPSTLLTVKLDLPPLRPAMTIRNLLYSPLALTQLNTKCYPDFMFAPSPEYGTSGGEEPPVNEAHGSSGILEGVMDSHGQDEHEVFDFDRAPDFFEEDKGKGEVQEDKEEENAVPIRDFTTLHRELNFFGYVPVSAEAMNLVAASLVVRIKHTTSSTYSCTVSCEQHIETKQIEPVQPTTDAVDENLSPTASKNINMYPTLLSSSCHSFITSERRSTQAALPLRRSHTDQAIANRSVTRLNRPHSSHISSCLINDGRAIDFSKYEMFSKATQGGMVEKLRDKEHHHISLTTTTTNISGDKSVRFPVKDIVTDLDIAVLSKQKRKHRCLFQMHNLRTISCTNSTSEKPYVMFRERKAILDGESSPRMRKMSSGTMFPCVPVGGSVQHRYESKLENNADEEREKGSSSASIRTKRQQIERADA